MAGRILVSSTPGEDSDPNGSVIPGSRSAESHPSAVLAYALHSDTLPLMRSPSAASEEVPLAALGCDPTSEHHSQNERTGTAPLSHHTPARLHPTETEPASAMRDNRFDYSTLLHRSSTTRPVNLASSSAHSSRRVLPVARRQQNGNTREKYPNSSDDSFAAPMTTQDADTYMSTTRAFNVPLVELGRSTQESSPEPRESPASRRLDDGISDADEDDCVFPPLNQYRPPSPSIEGNIIVAKTPSTEAYTQSTQTSLPASQQPGFYQPMELVPTQIIGNSTEIIPTQINEETQVTPFFEVPTQIIASPPNQPTQSPTPEPNEMHPSGQHSLIPPHIRQRYIEQGRMDSSGRVIDPNVHRPLVTSRINPTAPKSREIHRESEKPTKTAVPRLRSPSAYPSTQHSVPADTKTFLFTTSPRQLRLSNVEQGPDQANLQSSVGQGTATYVTTNPKANAIPPSEPDMTVEVERHRQAKQRRLKGKERMSTATLEQEESESYEKQGNARLQLSRVPKQIDQSPTPSHLIEGESTDALEEVAPGKAPHNDADSDLETESHDSTTKTFKASRKRKRARSLELRENKHTRFTPTFTEQQIPEYPQSGIRVFALWRKNDGYYYSATITAPHAKQPSKYCVSFDDDVSAEVDISKMRRCELLIGDKVALHQCDSGRGDGTVVHNDRWKDEEQVTVEYNGKNINLMAHQIKIRSAWINSSWGDRMVAPDAITFSPPPVEGQKSPVKPTRASAPLSKGCRRLTGNGFIISLSPEENNWEQRKDDLTSLLKSLGANVIDDWSGLFTLDGVTDSHDKRWTIVIKDVAYAGGRQLDRVFLLADKETTKPRYLFALACGIPCLQVDFIENFKQHGFKNWRSYILPAGFSPILDTRVAQRYYFDWQSTTGRMADLLTSRFSTNIFLNQIIIFVGMQFVPKRLGKRGLADKTREAYSSLPKIALAMGAKQIDAVFDVKLATLSLEEYRYAVLPDNEDRPEDLIRLGIKCMNVAQLKEYLISGICAWL